jgi:hypothetical protein
LSRFNALQFSFDHSAVSARAMLVSSGNNNDEHESTFIGPELHAPPTNPAAAAAALGHLHASPSSSFQGRDSPFNSLKILSREFTIYAPMVKPRCVAKHEFHATTLEFTIDSAAS